MDAVSWDIIDTYFKENPYNFVAHHLDSYNQFIEKGIFQILRENNPVRLLEQADKSGPGKKVNECRLYMGGKTGTRVYFGKPIVYDEDAEGEPSPQYMYPNIARLRNLTYGVAIHYDVEVEFTYYVDNIERNDSIVLEKMYMGKIPIMLHSTLCILKGMAIEARYNLGECRNDWGGYFIINGKEKVIVSQEKFGDNMIYVKENKPDNPYSYSCEIRSVSEDTSKHIRVSAVKMMAPDATYTNKQIVVSVPNVSKPVPLFILMRALGVISDKSIIEYCLLDLDKNADMVDLFAPSVHDASTIFAQKTALEYISSFTKHGTITSVFDILMNYFLPHVGDDNFTDKALYVGYMVKQMLDVVIKKSKPTDRDSFKYKRVMVSGALIYDLFREYWLIQTHKLYRLIDNEYFWHKVKYQGDKFVDLINQNVKTFFKNRIVETGIKKAFKGDWGATAETKKIGITQDLNRLSWFTSISQLRKINLPLQLTTKIVGPHLLHGSQWGIIDPVDTPDGGNVGLHKHMAISTVITDGYSSNQIIQWVYKYGSIKSLKECTFEELSIYSKVMINGKWIGMSDNPLKMLNRMKIYKRNGLIPIYTSTSFNYSTNVVYIYTDAGRLTRPILYKTINGKVSYDIADNIKTAITEHKIIWEELVSGTGEKTSNAHYYFKDSKVYDNIDDLYDVSALLDKYNEIVDKREKENKENKENKDYKKNYKKEYLEKEDYEEEEKTKEEKKRDKIDLALEQTQSIIDYVDSIESDGLYIANTSDELTAPKARYTNCEIDPSLMFGVMGNSIVFPEHNQLPRDVFSCGQSRQAVSIYHSNYLSRIDKMGVILEYGQVPLIKSRYLEYINKEQHPYGVNCIVAIMSYTGYNVEDAILINEGSISRGLFRTTYYSMYEAREDSGKISGSGVNSVFMNIEKTPNVSKTKQGYDYSLMDENGLIKKETLLSDKVMLIGQGVTDSENKGRYIDASTHPKKGQKGVVDKSFITEGEEGTRIAKIRVREERIPGIGDKMASRAGQKGTIGLIIPEQDMPFTSDGVRPDLIINPHALPSRMTIGQLIESLFGKACAEYGGYGDCTAYAIKGANYDTYGDMLNRVGYSNTGNQIVYNGFSGEPLDADIFIGPTYYMRLKHMVKDKINFRDQGPMTMLNRQPVQGRANDGGLRIGEMERDGIIGNGMSGVLNDAFINRGDEYFMAVCNKTGAIAVYNPARNLYLSPMADGPLIFGEAVDGTTVLDIQSVYGRSFSIVRIPYSLKLMIQELQVANIQMRVITEANINQILNLSYRSNNIGKLLNLDDGNNVTNEDIQNNISINNNSVMMMQKVGNDSDADNIYSINEDDEDTNADADADTEVPLSTVNEPTYNDSDVRNARKNLSISIPTESVSSSYIPFAPDSPYLGPYSPDSPNITNSSPNVTNARDALSISISTESGDHPYIPFAPDSPYLGPYSPDSPNISNPSPVINSSSNNILLVPSNEQNIEANNEQNNEENPIEIMESSSDSQANTSQSDDVKSITIS